MRIDIIAHFTDPTTCRFKELSRRFASKGYKVTLITSDFNHTEKKHRDVLYQYETYETVYIHEPGYPDNVSVKRLYSHRVWGLNVMRYIEANDVPDVIYCAIPSLTAAARAAKYCQQNNVKFVTDIQDLWPEAFTLVIKNKILQLIFKPLEWLANKPYSVADLTIAVSDTYRDRGLRVNKKSKRGLTVFLGNNLEVFDKAKKVYHQEKPANEFWIAYIGTMGYSYDIPCLLEAINRYNKKKTEKIIKFIAIGSGPLLSKYREYAKELNVESTFMGNVDYEKMVGVMCSCDVVANVIRKGAAQSITNKVGDYAFSGLPVINTQECEEYRNLVTEYGCGINCECENVDDIERAIERFICDPHLCKQMGDASRKLGEEKFDRNITYPKIVEAVENLIVK